MKIGRSAHNTFKQRKSRDIHSSIYVLVFRRKTKRSAHLMRFHFLLLLLSHISHIRLKKIQKIRDKQMIWRRANCESTMPIRHFCRVVDWAGVVFHWLRIFVFWLVFAAWYICTCRRWFKFAKFEWNMILMWHIIHVNWHHALFSGVVENSLDAYHE